MIELKQDTSIRLENRLLRKLEAFNNRACTFFKNEQRAFERVGVYAYDGKKMVGGAYAVIDETTWMFVHYLYVEEAYRDQKIGEQLMAEVEQLAFQKKCFGIRLETWGWQALGFYLKIGYKLFGKLRNHPPGYTEFHLKKVLAYPKK